MTGQNIEQDQIIVEYLSGPSRFQSHKSVDYMRAEVDNEIELYAESLPQENETASYDILKNRIIQQAVRQNINPNFLIFPYG